VLICRFNSKPEALCSAQLLTGGAALCLCHWRVVLLAAHPPQAESDVFATTGGDRSIALYDLRSARPIRKLVMQTRTNALAW